MEHATSISRRTALVGGIAALCSLAVPHAALADETPSATDALGQIEALLGELDDDELIELEELVRTEKGRRGVQSLPIGTGTYISGVDIDPGSYLIRVRPAEPHGDIFVTFTLKERDEDKDSWKQVAWDLIVTPIDYCFTMREGAKLEIDITDGACTIFPSKKISF